MNIDLTDAQYGEIVMALIGAALITIGFGLGDKRKNLLKSGIRVDGVVFSVERTLYMWATITDTLFTR